MVSFVVYDLTFLVLFSLFVAWFLYKRRGTSGFKREGIIFMYRTQFGIDAINYIGSNFKGTLHFLKYIIIGLGFVLMAAMVWMLGQTVAIYMLFPEITKLIKAPPIAPLIPYFPKLFGMESFFPPFYFTYFIVALAIVAIVHEFSHGIFMKLFKIKIKSTGLVFLGPILGAFVEQDDKSFENKKKVDQMAVLGAGVFANVVFALIFYGLYVAFFFSSFAASGYIFNSYGVAAVPLTNVTGFANHSTGMTEVMTENGTYYLDDGLAIQLVDNNKDYLVVYPEAPAVLAQMRGAIIQANDVKIEGVDKFMEFMNDRNPGDEVRFVTEDVDGVHEYDIALAEHPLNSSRPYLGVVHLVNVPRGAVGRVLGKFMSFKDSSTYYKPTWDGEFVDFILYLFWWVMIINLLVALFNMLPLGMLDGGRFFYLTILGITRSEKAAKRAYKFMGYLILFVFLLLMFMWFIRIV
ncbi:site-2 protease family protein [archaeon]|jgi:membrane-associated protease RseP (regulator of RpoE activity)|nr:site-2 protease family protein [archaeon]